MKRCTHCNETKSIEEFSRNRRRSDGRAQWCKKCSNEYLKAYNKRPENRPKAAARLREFRASRSPEQRREASRRQGLRKNYNMSVEEYDELLRQQNNRCAGCKRIGNNITSRALIVDHNHTTGQRRGLLCDRCNRALGLMADDPAVAQQLANYLVYHRSMLGGGVGTKSGVV